MDMQSCSLDHGSERSSGSCFRAKEERLPRRSRARLKRSGTPPLATPPSEAQTRFRRGGWQARRTTGAASSSSAGLGARRSERAFVDSRGTDLASRSGRSGAPRRRSRLSPPERRPRIAEIRSSSPSGGIRANPVDLVLNRRWDDTTHEPGELAGEGCRPTARRGSRSTAVVQIEFAARMNSPLLGVASSSDSGRPTAAHDQRQCEHRADQHQGHLSSTVLLGSQPRATWTGLRERATGPALLARSAGVRTRPPRHRRDPPTQNRGSRHNHRTLTDRRG